MKFPFPKENSVVADDGAHTLLLSQGQGTVVVFPGTPITGEYFIPAKSGSTKLGDISFRDTPEGVVCEGTLKKARHSFALERMSAPIPAKTVARGEILPDGLSAIVACAPTMGTDEYRTNLCCVRLDATSESGGETGHVVSTDGHRITWVKADVKHTSTISAEAVNLIHAHRKSVREIYHGVEGVVAVLSDGIEIHCPDQSHNTFPAWSQVIPWQSGFKWDTTLKRDEALAALKAHKALAGKGTTLSARFYEDKLVSNITEEGAELRGGDTLTLLSGLPAGPSVHVGINLQYLMDALSVFDDDVVVQGGDAFSVVQISSLPYGFTGETSPIRVGIMPMRV